jgi:lysophospholipase L1-like esterase
MKKQSIIYALLILSLLANAKFIFNKLYYVPEAPAKKKTYVQLRAIADAIPVNSNSIVFIGDSHIQNLKADKLFPGVHAVNLGIGEERSGQLLARIPITWKPKKVFVETGINDLRSGVPIDTMLNNLTMIVTRLKARAGAPNVYIHSLLPCNLSIDGTDLSVYPVIILANARIKKICTTAGVKFIDLFDSFAADQGLAAAFNLGDNMHLNEKGNQKWKEIIAPEVLTTFQASH